MKSIKTSDLRVSKWTIYDMLKFNSKLNGRYITSSFNVDGRKPNFCRFKSYRGSPSPDRHIIHQNRSCLKKRKCVVELY